MEYFHSSTAGGGRKDQGLWGSGDGFLGFMERKQVEWGVSNKNRRRFPGKG